MRNLDFSSWQAMALSFFALALVTLIGVVIRLVVMQSVQARRDRENRQINERLRTLIAAYKALGGSFTGSLIVDPRHKRELKDEADTPGGERTRRIRDAVEAALSDIILLGTEEQVELCAIVAQEPVTLPDQFARLGTDFAATLKRHRETLEAVTKDPVGQRAATKEFLSIRKRYAEETVALVRAHRDESAALDGALLLVGPMQWTIDPDLIEIALKRRGDRRAAQLCFDLRRRGDEPWAVRLVEGIAEDNPNREVRGCATFCRAELLLYQAFPTSGGRLAQSVPPEVKDPLVAGARRFYAEVAKDYADVRTPDGKATIGEKAAHELARLDNLPNLKVGGMAPDLVGEAVDGSRLSLSDYRGKVVVLVFWGTWCAPCMAMVPHERELVKKLEGQPFAMLGVNGGETREAAKGTMEKNGMTCASFWDGEEIAGPITTDYDVQRWPTVFVIDAKGVIRFINVRNRKLEEAVESLLAEMKSSLDEGIR